MNKSYVIEWKSKTNGRVGRGTTLFDRQEAETLAEELNRDYPEIEHLPVQVEEGRQPQEAMSLPG
jgi:hypothetical protein